MSVLLPGLASFLLSTALAAGFFPFPFPPPDTHAQPRGHLGHTLREAADKLRGESAQLRPPLDEGASSPVLLAHANRKSTPSLEGNRNASFCSTWSRADEMTLNWETITGRVPP